MKYTLNLIGMLFAFLFFSCAHTDEPIIPTNPTDDPIPVTFNASILTIEISPFTRSVTKEATIGDIVTTIGCAVYDSNGKIVVDYYKEFNPLYESAPEDFGKISATLLPGKYKLLMYALGKGNGAVNQLFPNDYSSDLGLTLGNREVFYKCQDIEISTSLKEMEITLSRKSALLRVEITDEVHEDVGKVIYEFNQPQKWNAYYNRGEGDISVKQEISIVDKRLEIFEYYIPFPNSYGNFKVSVFKKDGSLLFDKTLSLPFEVNRKTIVRGNLFSNLDGKLWEILIEDAWGEDMEYPI